MGDEKLYKKITISSLEDIFGETFSEGFTGNFCPSWIIYAVIFSDQWPLNQVKLSIQLLFFVVAGANY